MNAFSKLNPAHWHLNPELPLLKECRDRAWKNFLQRGLPRSNEESWHYTDLNKFLTVTPQAVQQSDSALTDTRDLVSWSGPVVVYQDGEFQPQQSRLPAGVELISLATAIQNGVQNFSPQEFIQYIQNTAERASQEQAGLLDLHQALLAQGSVLCVSDQTTVEPIKIKNIWSESAEKRMGVMTRFIWLGKRSKATFFEETHAPQNLSTLSWTHIELKDSAHLQYTRLQQNQTEGLSLGTTTVQQDKNSEALAVTILAGGKMGRETWLVDQQGESATTRVHSLQLGEGQTHLDMHTVIHHHVAHGFSEQRARILAADRSRLVMSGKIVIAKDAQMVNSSQLSQGLLLGEQAEIDNQPQLEIYADNVKANHGASVGQMDEEEIFYLQSRGLTKAQAQQMLAEAFARQTMGLIQPVNLRFAFEEWLKVQLKNLFALRSAT